MKKFTLILSVVVLATTLITGCSPKLKPLTAGNFSIDPNPLVVVGDKVETNVTMTVPAKWMNKKATVRLIPAMKYGSGEAWSATSTIQGESVLANHTIIPYNNGGIHTFKASFNYEPRMVDGDFYVTFKADVNGKAVKLPEVKIAHGIIATGALASITGSKPYFAPDAFQRIITDKYDTDIHFLIQQADVRPHELSKAEVKEWKSTVEEASAASNQKVAVEVQAYASPDGGYELNKKLSEQREKSTTKMLEKSFDKQGKEIPLSTHYTAQDWDGFRKYVEASDIEDKELILRVLSMYNDPEEREREIRNISVVFDRLASEILPKLRRSRLTATIETIGKSDEELTKLLTSTPGELNIEEILYATALQNASAREKYLLKAVELFPNDARAYNNLAAIYMQRGELEAAYKMLDRASKVEDLPEVRLNKALLALQNGQVSEAEALIGNALTTQGSEEAIGYLYLKQGKYDEAAKTLENSKTNNAAVAQIMVGNYDKAMATLDAIERSNAMTDYLRAVTAARQRDARAAASFLQEAFSRDASLRSYAAKDAEFEEVKKNAAFTIKL